MALSYEDTVNSLNPVAFWRLNEVGGTVMSDSSGNAHHGTFYPGANFGLPSPIVTDPSSFAIGGAVGEAPALDSSPLDASLGSTVGGWLYWREDYNGDTATLLSRTANWAALGGFIGVGQSAALVPGWYFLVGTRNGSVQKIFLNAELNDQRIDLGTLTEYPRHIIGFNNGQPDYRLATRHTSDQPWIVGVDSSIFYGNVDEPFVFDYPLNDAQILAIYEAGIGATFLKGRADATPTGILRSTFEPNPISFPFRHNWTETLIERISFRSAISRAITGVEEPVAETAAPRREFEWTQVLRDNRERRKLRALLWANQHAKWFIPVRQYAEQLQDGLSASATSTPISTAYKDYEVGAWIGFRQLSASGEVSHWEERLITAVNVNSVEHEPLVHSYAPYLCYAYPVRRALLRPQISVKGHTDAVEEIVITTRLLPEDEQLIPNRITPFSPTIKYRDVEVFDGRIWQANDWSEQREYEVERSGEEVDFDTGLISFGSDTVGASETSSYRMTLEGIDRISEFLGWYYERVGALQPLWVATMQEDFEILFINIPEHQITVKDTNYSDSYALAEPRRDLAFVYRDGTMAFRRVIAFELAGENETLRLDALVPTTTNLRFVSLLKYCRLDADQLELAWQTDRVVQVAWRFRELLNTPEGTGVSSLSPSSSLSHSFSPSGSASPSASESPSLSPSLSPSPSSSVSPSGSISPSSSTSPSHSASSSTSLSTSPSSSLSPSSSSSPSV